MELTAYWTRFAEDRLNDIFEYYEINASPEIARKLILGIIKKTIALEKTHI